MNTNDDPSTNAIDSYKRYRAQVESDTTLNIEEKSWVLEQYRKEMSINLTLKELDLY